MKSLKGYPTKIKNKALDLEKKLGTDIDLKKSPDLYKKLKVA